MAAKKTASLSLTDIEKNIARLTAELHKARVQKVSDAEKNLQEARKALAAATDKANQRGAAKTGKGQPKKAKIELENHQQLVAAAEDNLHQAKLALEISIEAAKEAAKVSAQPGSPNKASTKTKAQSTTTSKTTSTAAQEEKQGKKKEKKIATGDKGKTAAVKKSPPPASNTEVKTDKQPGSAAAPKDATTESLPKPRPVDPEPMGTAVTVPPASESSLLPEHGFTKLIEPRDNPLPKPQPL